MSDTVTSENELQALKELQDWANKWRAEIAGSGYGIVVWFRKGQTSYFVNNISWAEPGNPKRKITMTKKIEL